jgi:hypothetical protein
MAFSAPGVFACSRVAVSIDPPIPTVRISIAHLFAVRSFQLLFLVGVERGDSTMEDTHPTARSLPSAT